MILKLFGAKIQRHFINSVEMYILARKFKFPSYRFWIFIQLSWIPRIFLLLFGEKFKY